MNEQSIMTALFLGYLVKTFYNTCPGTISQTI